MICVFAAKLIYASAEAKSSTPENPYVVTEKDLRRLGVTGPNYAVWASDLEKKATLKSEEYASSIEAARRNLKKQH